MVWRWLVWLLLYNNIMQEGYANFMPRPYVATMILSKKLIQIEHFSYLKANLTKFKSEASFKSENFQIF